MSIDWEAYKKKAKKIDKDDYEKNIANNDIAPIRETTTSTSDDFAPVRPSLSDDFAPIKEKKRTWFQKSKYFADGSWDKGDLTKTILGSFTDLGENAGAGVVGMGEKVLDALAMVGNAMTGQALNQAAQNEMIFNTVTGKDADNVLGNYQTTQRKITKETEDFVKKDLYDEEKVAKKIISAPVKKYTGIDAETDSVFGEKSDALAQSGGQLLATVGLQAIGVPWFLTSGATSFGSQSEEALNEGATYEEAMLGSAVSAGAEILTEKLSGGIKFGGKTLDDALLKPLIDKISNKAVKLLVKGGLDAAGEGFEEVVSGFVSNLGTKLYKEEDLSEILFSEEALDEYLESFIGGAVLGGGSSAVTQIANRNAIELSENEQKVFDKEVENRIAEEEKDGKKVTKKEESAIRKAVLNDMLKGYISIDTIESTLGGETYNNYKKNTEQEKSLQDEFDTLNKMKQGDMTGEQIDRRSELKQQLEEIKNNSKTNQIKEQLSNEVFELAKDSRLAESYNEKARRSQSFEADLSKYDAKQQEIVKKAIESGTLNNTNRAHEFVDMVAKISADKGVLFDFTNNEKIKNSSFAVEGKIVNGYVDNGTITLNTQSPKYLNTVVGHEITHVLEGTELYNALQDSVIEFAKSKGEFATRMQSLRDLYTGNYKGVDFDTKLKEELTADLVGEYLFTDTDFINNLSTKSPNVFKRIYNEIKYLCKIATAGSKEARELERVKRAFDKAWKESATAQKNTTDKGGVKYLLSGINKDGIEVYETSQDTMDLTWVERKAKYLDVLQNEYCDRTARFKRNGHTYYAKFDQSSLRKHIYGDKRSSKDGVKALIKAGADGDVFDLVENSQYDFSKPNKKNNTNADYFDYFIKTVQIDGKVFDLVADVEKDYGVKDGYVYTLALRDNKKIKASPAIGTSQSEPLQNAGNTLNDDILPQNSEKSIENGVFSTNDSEGRALSTEQNEYFKESKIRDANGNLKVMYHGSSETFTVFDRKKARSSGTYGNGFYFTDSKSHAGTYGDSYEVYLNITNPLQDGTSDITKEQLRKFVEEIAENEDYGIENYGYGATIDSVVDSVYGKSDFGMLTDLNITCIGNMVEAVELFNKINGTDYDGIVAPTETVAFYPNQIKKVDNKTPTSNSDIRYSLSIEDIETKYKDKTDYLFLHERNDSISISNMVVKEEYRNKGIGTQILNDVIAYADEKGKTITLTPTTEFGTQNRLKKWYKANGFVENKGRNADLRLSDTMYRLPKKNNSEKAKSQKQFSLSNSVEETKELVAVHGMTTQNLISSLELGGLPMPSIAIIKARMGHNKYGDVSLVFGKETIDPELNNENKVYGLDVWSPVYPPIEFKVNESIASKIQDKYYKLGKEYGYDEVRPLYAYAEELERQLNNAKGEQGLLEDLYNDVGLMKVYLLDSGKPKVEPITKEERTALSDMDVESIEFLIGEIGRDVIDEFTPPEGVRGPWAQEHRKAFWDKHLNEVQNAYENMFIKLDNFTEEDAKNIVDNTSRFELNNWLKKIVSYIKNGKEQIKVTEDRTATEEAIKKAAQDGYVEWVNDLFKGVAEKSGIRNNVDYIDKYGNRRDWEALHYANKLENVVRVMKGQENGNSFFNAGSLWAIAAKDYGTIQEIKADSNRLKLLSEDEYSALKKAIGARVDEIADSLNSKYSDSNYFIEHDNKINNLFDAIKSSKTKSGVLKYLNQYFTNATEATVTDLLDVISDAGNLPTEYFEAKPQRAVMFDEVKAVIIPDNAPQGLREQLESMKLNVLTYEHGNDNSRTEALNSIEDVKFSLSEEGEHPTKHGNLHIKSEDVAYQPTDDIAPVREDIAPVGVAENATTIPDDVAPVKEVKKPKTPNTAQPVAKILTEEPKTEKEKSKLWSKIKTNFIDKASPFETLALKTGNREVDAKFNSIRYSDSKAQMLIGEGAEGVKALNDIQAEVETEGLTEELYEYVYHKHNIDRMSLQSKEAPNLKRLSEKLREFELDNLEERQLFAISKEPITKNTKPKRTELIETVRKYLESKAVKNKPVFGSSVTAEMSQQIVDKYEAENPKVIEYANEIYNYNKYLRDLLVEAGIISQETADLWQEVYPYYVPIRRLGDEGLNVNVPLDSRRTGVNSPVKKATGGNRDILPLFNTMAQRTFQTYKAIAKNNFGVELKNTLGSVVESSNTNLDEVIDSIDTQEELLQKGKNGRNPTFTVFENGKRVTFEITDEMYDAMKPTSEGLAYTNKVANKISNATRGVLTEYNPTFMLTNAIKDAQDVLINSQHPVKTYANFPKAIAELATKGEWYTEYIKNGGADNTYFDKQKNAFDKEKSKLSKVIGFPLDKISKANNFIERIPRLAEYIASREAGRSIDVSMLDAARVTTNFAAGGDVTKFLNRNGATFLNASVQGAAQQVRNVREAKANGLKGWVQLATKVAIAGLPGVLLNGLLWDEDEDYEELSDYVKENYYIVGKTQGGKFVRIPKGRALAVIQNAFTQVQNALTGDDEVDLQNFVELAVSNLAPNNPIDNNILAPIAQVWENKTWYGEDLVPTRLQDLPNAEQYDESTDAISKWLGETLNVSPYKINYLLNQYTGGVGDVVLPMLTPEAESGEGGFLLAPLKDKFTTDSVLNNQNSTDFYNMSDELTKNANSKNATDEDILKNKYFNSVSDDIGELYKAKREVQNSDLPDKEKFNKAREIQKQINELAKNALSNVSETKNAIAPFYGDTGNGLKMYDGYATIGGLHYRTNDDGEWQKITGEQLEKQNEVTNGLGITPSEYWKNKSEYDFAYEKPGKYAVAKAVADDVMEYKRYTDALGDIRADKDSNGNSISGTAKAKKIDYINGLDIDYGAKCILIKSEYSAEDRYNSDILDYLNSRNDLSMEDKKTILKELGATVDAEGNVYWN